MRRRRENSFNRLNVITHSQHERAGRSSLAAPVAPWPVSHGSGREPSVTTFHPESSSDVRM
jgi:hypothetical protein